MAIGEGLARNTSCRAVDDCLKSHVRTDQAKGYHSPTLLWSMISEMTAMWPACGPVLRSTTVGG